MPPIADSSLVKLFVNEKRIFCDVVNNLTTTADVQAHLISKYPNLKHRSCVWFFELFNGYYNEYCTLEDGEIPRGDRGYATSADIVVHVTLDEMIWNVCAIVFNIVQGMHERRFQV